MLRRDEFCRLIANDWYNGEVPDNVVVGKDAYIDTSYAFAAFHSIHPRALIFGERSGAYIRSSFIVGANGRVTIGESSIVNGTYVVCEESVDVGSHCLLSWGTFITDSWPSQDSILVERRRAAVVASAENRLRPFPHAGGRRVIIEDNVWVGFDCVIMPGVTLGHGCVIGSRTIIDEDVPPYAVVVGDPPRIVRYLDPTDRRPELRPGPR